MEILACYRHPSTGITADYDEPVGIGMEATATRYGREGVAPQLAQELAVVIVYLDAARLAHAPDDEYLAIVRRAGVPPRHEGRQPPAGLIVVTYAPRRRHRALGEMRVHEDFELV